MTCPRCKNKICGCVCEVCRVRPMREVSGGCGNCLSDGRLWCGCKLNRSDDMSRDTVGMTITTSFAPGDTAWCLYNYKREPVLLTVGQVRVEITDSPGVDGGRVEPGYDIAFDNYKPQQSRKETYMMVETGIGSGSVYTLGESVFATKAEAEAAKAARGAE